MGPPIQPRAMAIIQALQTCPVGLLHVATITSTQRQERVAIVVAQIQSRVMVAMQDPRNAKSRDAATATSMQ
jgi:hypothetical protein